MWRPANNFLKAVESESQFFGAKAADKPSKIVKLFAGRDTSGRDRRKLLEVMRRKSDDDGVASPSTSSW